MLFLFVLQFHGLCETETVNEQKMSIFVASFDEYFITYLEFVNLEPSLTLFIFPIENNN